MNTRHAKRHRGQRLRVGLRARLRALYHGHSKEAVRFRLAVIALDVLIIGFFMTTRWR